MGERKNLPHELARDLCEVILAAGFVPVILDWDRRTPLADQERIFNPGAGCGLWGNIGTGDAEVLAALSMYHQSLQRKSRTEGQTIPALSCSTYFKGEGCGFCAVNEKTIMATVVNTIQAKLSPIQIEQLRAAVTTEIRNLNSDESSTSPADFLAQSASIDQKISMATERLITVSSKLVKGIEGKILELHARREELERQFENQAQLEKVRRNSKKIPEKIRDLAEVLRMADPKIVRVRTVSVHFAVPERLPSRPPWEGPPKWSHWNPPSRPWKKLRRTPKPTGWGGRSALRNPTASRPCRDW